MHVHCRSPFSGNAFHLPIKDRAFVHPRVKHGANGSPQLIISASREVFSRLLLHCCLKTLYEFLQVFNFEFVVELDTLGLLYIFDNFFEGVDILLIFRLHAQHDVAIHLYKATIRVPGESRVTRFAG